MTKPLRFDLADLRLFVAIAELGSLSKAAEALPLALSAASSRLRLMEDRLGMSFFDRHATGLTPTEAGVSFLAHARRILRSAQDAQQDMEGLAGRRREELTVWANVTATATILPELLGRFIETHPYMDVTLAEKVSEEVADGVIRGDADIGVMDSRVQSTALEFLPVCRYRLAVLAPPGHALAAVGACAFSEVTRHPLVAQAKDSAMQIFLSRVADLQALEMHVRVRAPTFPALAHLVASGVGLAVMPERVAQGFRASLGLTLIELTDDWATRELVVGWRPSERVPAKVRALARALAGMG